MAPVRISYLLRELDCARFVLARLFAAGASSGFQIELSALRHGGF
jgi:hypothetical protein